MPVPLDARGATLGSLSRIVVDPQAGQAVELGGLVGLAEEFLAH
jgi:hypothetical protein